MSVALICSPLSMEEDLSTTTIWREGVERHTALTADEAIRRAGEMQVNIVLIDRDMTGADRVVAALRRDVRTRRTSIVIIARGELDPIEVELLEAGANAILRLPAGPEWEERLERLIQVPVRRELRAP